MKNVVLLFLMLLFSVVQATTYYSDSGNSDPNDVNNWWTATNNTGLPHPTDFTNASDIFIIQAGHSYTTTATWDVSGVSQEVQVDGTLVYDDASTVTDLTINGTGTVTANAELTLQVTGTWTMASGAVYDYNHANALANTFAGTESFHANSIFKISTFPTTAHALEDNSSSCTGGYPSVTWNFTGQSTVIDWGNNPFTINGDFLISSTGSGSVFISNATSDHITVSGDMTITGGTIIGSRTGSGGDHDINVAGNFLMSGGSFDLGDGGSYGTTLLVTGNFTHTAGTLQDTGASAKSGVTLNGTAGVQTLESVGTTGSITFNVAASNAQCNVAAAKTFTLSTSATLVVGAGTASPDMDVDGTIQRDGGTLTLTGTGNVDATGEYVHNVNNKDIPSWSWTAGGLCNVTGVVGNTIGGTKNKTFEDFTWNCAGQTIACNLLEATGTASFTVNGTMTVINTNGSKVGVGTVGSGTATFTVGTLDVQGGTVFFNDNVNEVNVTITTVTQSGGTIDWDAGGSTSPNTVAISGNMTVSGGVSNVTTSTNNNSFTVSGNLLVSGTGDFYGSTSTGDPTINITGSFTTSGGSATFYGTSNSGGIPTFNIQGAVDISAGTVGASSASLIGTSLGTYNLTGAATNTLKLPTTLAAATTANWSWTIVSGRTVTLASDVELGGNNVNTFVNSGILDVSTFIVKDATGATTPTFTNAAAATLKTANVDGLSTTAATGSIQTTGSNVFSSASSFVYNGASAQVTGNFGASTTPTASRILDLELDNSAGVTLTAALTLADGGTLTLTDGYHDLSSFTLTVGVAGATSLVHTAGGLYSSSENGSLARYMPAAAITSASGNNYGLFPFAKTDVFVSKIELNSTVDLTGAGLITITQEFAGAQVDVSYADDQATVDRILDGAAFTVTEAVTGGTLDLKWTFMTLDNTGNASDITISTYVASTMSHIGTYGANTGTKSLPVVHRTGIASADLAKRFVIGTYDNTTSPLPVELISFDLKQLGDKEALVSWSTASELNNDYFSLEYALNNSDYNWIGDVVGAGNTIEASEYNFNYSNLKEGNNYFRLSQTDFDGQKKMIGIRSIYVENKDNQILSHVLVKDGEISFSIELSEEEGCTYMLLDTQGKMISHKLVRSSQSENHSISTNGQSSGLYVLVVYHNGSAYSRRIVL